MVNAKDESSIASGIVTLAIDMKLKQRLSSSGPMTAKLYSWERTAKEHLEYYYELISGISSQPVVE